MLKIAFIQLLTNSSKMLPKVVHLLLLWPFRKGSRRQKRYKVERNSNNFSVFPMAIICSSKLSTENAKPCTRNKLSDIKQQQLCKMDMSGSFATRIYISIYIFEQCHKDIDIQLSTVRQLI
jgi:hypothetical protein